MRTHQKRLTTVIISVLIVITIYFLIDALLHSLPITMTTIWTWLVCVSVLFVADLLSAPTGNKQWAGFLFFSISIAWMTLGVGPALIALFVSVGLTAFLRWRNVALPLWDHSLPYISFDASSVRMAVIGAGVLVMSALFAVFNGFLPIDTEKDLLLAIIAMCGGFSAVQLVGYLISDPLEESEFGAILFHRDYFARQVFILSLAIPFVVVRQDSGMIIFTILMGLIALQPVRTYQIRYTQRMLHQRVQELSLLSHVGQSISTEATLDAVLNNICDQVCALVDISLFYIGLYDEKRNVMEFPWVMRDGKREYWDNHPLESETFMDMMDMHSVLKVRRGHDTNMDQLFVKLSNDIEHRIYLGLPLIVGSKLIGIMVLIGTEEVLNPSNVQISTMKTLANQAALAIRNTILYGRSTQLAQNLNLINRSVQDVMFNLDDSSSLQAACDIALKITGANKAAIFLIDNGDKSPVRLVRSVGLTDEHRELYDNPIYHPTVFSTDIHPIADVTRLSERDVLVDLAKAGEFQAMVEVPLKQGSSIIGELVVFHNEAHYYHLIELELLEILAYHITSALDNAQLLGALEEYASEQAQLVQLSRISTSSLNIKLVIANVCDMLQQIMDVNHVSVGLLSGDKQQLQIYNSEGVSKSAVATEDIRELYHIIHTKPVTPRVFRKEQHPKSFREFSTVTNTSLRMLAVNPLAIKDDLLGFIFLGNENDYSFTDGEWRRIEMAVNQITTQLHNIQEHTRIQTALEKRLQELSIIEDIAHQISSAHDPDEIIYNVMEAAILSTQADLASFTLVADDNTFRILILEYVDGQIQRTENVVDNIQGVVTQVLRTKETLIIADNDAEPDYVGPTLMRHYRSSLLMPLQDGDKEIIGVLNLESTKLGYFDTEHLKFTKNLVRHASISIQNARLLTERQGQIETLTCLRDLSLQFAGDTTQEAVVAAILRTAIELLQGHSAVLFLNRGDDVSTGLPMLGCLRRVGETYLADRLPVPQSLVTQVVESGEIHIVEDIKEDEHFENYYALSAVDYKGLMLAPLKRGGEVLEILCVALPVIRPHRKSDENTLALLSIQAAGHLQNAILYERIRTDSSRMRAILDSTRDGIILLDPNGQLIDANMSAEDLLDIDLESRIGKNFLQVLTTHLEEIALVDKESPTYASLSDLAKVLRLEPQRITSNPLEILKDDKLRYIEEIGSPVYNENAQIMGRLLTLRDVTEERLLHAYRDEISSMVVHDLRGPLGAIISSLDLATEIIAPFNNSILEDIVRVSLHSAKQLLGLVDSLLDIAKLETRRMPLTRTWTTVSDLAESAAKVLTTVAQESDIEIQFNIPDDLPEVLVDADKIRRVMINLLDNAIRFSPSGQPIMIAAEQVNGKRVKVLVADSGRGIPPEEFEKVFEKFRQISGNKPTRGSKGTGLGLTFCKLTVEAHGESIWIEQDGPLPGACFVFTLPTVESDQRSTTTFPRADATLN